MKGKKVQCIILQQQSNALYAGHEYDELTHIQPILIGSCKTHYIITQLSQHGNLAQIGIGTGKLTQHVGSCADFGSVPDVIGGAAPGFIFEGSNFK